MEAVDAARAILLSRRPALVQVKGDRDVVSDVDLAIERTVREHLAHATPGIGLLGEEEGGADPVSANRCWVLDPIDGTANFVAGSPLCGISLALVEAGHPVLGVVDLPMLGERYTAEQGGGAACNGSTLRIPAPQRLGEAIVAVGDFATGSAASSQNPDQLRIVSVLAERTSRVRMLGSAAIDLAWLAAGRHHASVTLCNRPWDMAAGVVIATEAGAWVGDLGGASYSLGSGSVIAAAPGLAPELLAAIRA